MLGIKPDLFSFTSDHFQLILDSAEKLIKSSDAFVDDVDAETMRGEREARQESKNRNNCNFRVRFKKYIKHRFLTLIVCCFYFTFVKAFDCCSIPPL